MSPTFDLTVTGRGYSKQGFLGEAEWRQKFNNGEYSIKAAGISQNDPEEFNLNTVDRGPDGDLNKFRGMVGSKGKFTINPRWSFGWDVLYQTDKNFSRTYQIGGYEQAIHRSEIYLTGLNQRNYFDLRFMRFEVQEELRDEFRNRNGDIIARNEKQPWVLPSFDYSVTPETPVFGGELNIDINARILRRSELDRSFDTGLDPLDPADDRIFAVRGVEGTTGRLTAEAEWKRTFVTSAGLVITPLLHVQGDANFVDQSQLSVDAHQRNGGKSGDRRRDGYPERIFPLHGDCGPRSALADPVFDVERDACAGTGRTDIRAAGRTLCGHSRAFRTRTRRALCSTRPRCSIATSIPATTAWKAERGPIWACATPAPSPMAGRPTACSGSPIIWAASTRTLRRIWSMSVPIRVWNRTGPIMSVSSASPRLAASLALVGGRFDEETFEMRRLETKAAYMTRPFSVQAKYAFIQAQPLYGFERDREEVSFGASKRFRENWRVFGSGTYDIEQDLMTQNAFGFGYDDECFSLALTYAQTRRLIGNTREVDENPERRVPDVVPHAR